MQDSFSDCCYSEDPYPTLTYRSGLAVYQESLIDGQFVGRGWNASGGTNPEYERVAPAKHAAPQAFWGELEGQLLRSHWEWSGWHRRDTERGLVVTVELRHTVRPVSVCVHTLLDGTPILTRWLEIESHSDQPAALSTAFPWSGVLQVVPYVVDSPATPYSVGYFQDSHWGNEGDFAWAPLPCAGYRIDGRYRSNRHRHPFFILRNALTGEHFVGTLAWSGGYSFEFDLNDGYERGTAGLSFRAGPDAPAPQRVLASGETVTTPAMHLGVLIGDLDECVNTLHEHLRRSALYVPPRDRAGLVESGIGPEVDITLDQVYHNLDIAHELGAEVFFIDAGWYTAQPSTGKWWPTVGDWEVSQERFPGGLKAISDRAHAKGLLFGLWMDAERIGAESKMARAHPEWLARGYDGHAGLGGMIDLTEPCVAQWMEEQIARVIGENELDFFRLDYNVANLQAGSQSRRHGYVESGYWRYYEVLYGIYERLRARFPRVIFENCAGGGGRTDVGLLRYFNHTWITDWQIAPRSFSIVNGMTMALPSEKLMRIGPGMGQSQHRCAEFDFQCRLSLFVLPTVGWIHLIGMPPNPILTDRARHHLEIFKSFVRPMQGTSRIYHHTPEVRGLDPSGWGVLEVASADRSRALVGLFRLADPAAPEYVVRLRGVDVGRRYRVAFDNLGEEATVDGYTLATVGVPVRLEAPLTSELLLVQPAGS